MIDKWFNAQALTRLPGAIDKVLELEQHPEMDIMNMPRAMAVVQETLKADFD